ncbi:MAG: hypothetical protein GY950_33110 [bacterium]|nr:hypothetical protein [bacterium]
MKIEDLWMSLRSVPFFNGKNFLNIQLLQDSENIPILRPGGFPQNVLDPPGGHINYA